MTGQGGQRGWRQLALDFRWDESAELGAFVPGPNAEAVAAVRRAAVRPGQPVYLYGEPGTGKTHLLQSACSIATAAGRTAVYLPLEDMLEWSAGLLDGLENVGVVALDDLHLLRNRPAWQEALFFLFNRLRDAGGQLMVAADQRPDRIGLTLPDLVSRLQWGLVFRLRELSDEDRLEALRRRAASRGIELPEETARYLLAHYPRRTRYLFGLLEELDVASLQAHRRLTIPFLKRVLGPSDARE
ncbi:DnaA regulatory inactivator Hda [Arhodomonas sp. AD133]|uniref:DnaA regulatory inactivator Hda n=1 Tax=Arhodomonas sp. AD133 TaxID=3415009 RepID=UPI003EBCDCE3